MLAVVSQNKSKRHPTYVEISLKGIPYMFEMGYSVISLSLYLLIVQHTGKCKLYTDTIEDDRIAMLEAGIKTLDEVKTLDVHVDPLTNMNKSTNPAAAVDVDNAAAAAKEMISKLLEGGTAFKGEMSLMIMMVVMNDDDNDDDEWMDDDEMNVTYDNYNGQY